MQNDYSPAHVSREMLEAPEEKNKKTLTTSL